MTSGASWYVVFTRPNGEELAAQHLKRQGFSTYLPRRLTMRRHARKQERVIRPLFPRYLFVGLELGAQRWRSVHSTVGVSRLVCRGDDPAPVPAGVVERLIDQQDENGCIRLAPSFRAGDRVRIREGAFADLVGLYEEITDSQRVTLLLDLLGRQVRVAVAAEYLEPSR
jgi:transcriptional antiterminator RfaH